MTSKVIQGHIRPLLGNKFARMTLLKKKTKI